VDKCNTTDCSNVILTECGDAYSAPCGHRSQQWQLQVPPHISEPNQQWFVSVNALPAEPMCMEIPLGGPNVDIYDCTVFSVLCSI
jgi:hypothetical protein